MRILFLLILLAPLLSNGQISTNFIKAKYIKHSEALYDEPSLLTTPVDSIRKDDVFWIFSAIRNKELQQPFLHIYKGGKVRYLYASDYGRYILDNSDDYKNMRTLEQLGDKDDFTRMSETMFYVDYLDSVLNKKKHDDSIQTLQEIAHGKRLGLLINYTTWNYAHEYSNFVNFEVSVSNYSKKTIKYIRFYLAAKDAVGGRISYLNRTVFPVRGVGPIKCLDYGQYTFEDVFYSKIVDTVYVTRIDVEYMDGSTKNYTNIKELRKYAAEVE